MLKTLGSIESTNWSGKGGFEIDGGSRAGCDRNELDRSKTDGSKVDSNEFGDDKIEKKVQKLSKSKNLSKSKKIVKSDFFTLGAKLVFTELKQIFVKVPILHHFDPECHI